MAEEAIPVYHPRSRHQDQHGRRLGIGRNIEHQRTARIRVQSHPNADDIDPRKIKMLPALAEDYYSDKLVTFGWNGVLKTVLSGTRDKQSPLNRLREHEETIAREIFTYISNQWARHVKLTVPAALVGQSVWFTRMRFNHGRLHDEWRRRDLLEDSSGVSKGFDNGFVAFSRCGSVSFPPPAKRNVNMLPFIFGSKWTLPDDLKCYHSLIEQCPYLSDEIGKVGYLTVHESYVDATKAQRREGLHIESPGVFKDAPDNKASFEPAVEHPWGAGVFYGPDRYEGGIYMASSVSNTSKVWDALVDKNYPGIVDKHGGCEHLRSIIGTGTKLRAGELIWMTDCTPHEALPQETSSYRQFFRVVSSNISHWYEDHSTRNPNVDLPAWVKIVRGNKFETM